jgi:D-alanyl-D-alanine-carboxypeptidase/D-alanyl-D-alanine-endopeptidase
MAAFAALTILLTGAAPCAEDRSLREAVEFTGAILFHEHKVPALLIGAVRGGERVITGLGETQDGSGVVPDGRTTFRIGSVTKAFAGEVLAAMAVDGSVKLTDSLEKYLGWNVHVPSRDGRTVRLIDLATHSGGFPREVPHESGPPDSPFGTITKEAFIAYLRNNPLIYTPGTGAVYSNMGFDLLAAALAGAASKPYSELVRERITGPLGMKDTTFAPNADQKAHLLQGHGFDREPWPNVPTGDVILGSGGLYSSASDMLTWLQWHLDRFAERDAEVRLADHAMWLPRDGLSPVFGFDESGRMDGLGLAWIIMMPDAKHPLILQKAGGLQGVFCYAAFAPARGVGVFVAINQFNLGAALSMATAVNDLIAALAP